MLSLPMRLTKILMLFFFFFQAEDGIRDSSVTGVQTCALPIFEPAMRDSAAYREFWASLNRGEYQAAEYKRIGKGGKEVWILAGYNPILDEKGRPFKVVKCATDVTEQKLRTADLAGQIAAIGKSQAVIEFNMDGSVLPAN